MKKVLIILVAVLLLTACSKQEKNKEEQLTLAIDINDLNDLGLKPALKLDVHNGESEQLDSLDDNQVEELNLDNAQNLEQKSVLVKDVDINQKDINFGQKNGRLISYEEKDNYVIVTREFFMENESWYLPEPSDIYDNIQNKKVIGAINPGDYYDIKELTFFEPKQEETDVYDVWCKIKVYDGESGWINLGKHKKGSLPYTSDEYSVVDEIVTDTNQWTVRKLVGHVAAWGEFMEIRDVPGFNGSNVIKKVVISEKQKDGTLPFKEIFLTYTLITEETEKHGDKEEPWLFIEYQGVSGWIYGGTVDTNRGGTKYNRAEDKFIFNMFTCNVV